MRSLPLLLPLLPLLLPVAHIQGRPHATCKGGRMEGDKWFDGCQWCVCEEGGPVCSPIECSEYVAHVPPCDNLGSRWRDGCYHCTCGISGIECTADRICMARKRIGSKSQKGFLSGGKCMEPMDYRCICGVDGVPSCSAEVIDRSAYTSTLIIMNVTRPTSLSHLRRNGHHRRDLLSTEERRRSRKSGQDSNPEEDGYLIRSRTKRRVGAHSYYNSAKQFDLSSLGLRQSRSHRRTKPYRNINDFASWQNDVSDLAVEPDPSQGAHSSRRRHSDSYYRSHRSESEDRSFNYRSYPLPDIPPSNAPSSLLVATDNRCKFGPRWYGGSLRCYCDVSGSITCGDPSFVATRIDGFRVESKLCENGHIWEEEKSCRSCECHFSTLVVCRRSPMCPMPYLLRSSPGDVQKSKRTGEFRGGKEAEIAWNRNQDDGDLTDMGERADKEQKFGSRRHLGGKHVDDLVDIEVDDEDLPLVDGSGGNSKPIEDEEVGPGRRGGRSKPVRTRKGGEFAIVDRGDDIVIDLGEPATAKPDLVIDVGGDGVGIGTDRNTVVALSEKGRGGAQHGDRKHHKGHDENRNDVSTNVERRNSRHTTMVTVRECNPGSRWREGCARCRCTSGGTRNCNRSRCPSFDNPANIRARPRYRPITQSPPRTSCGSHRFGARYWRSCNLCLCTRAGPKCTARSCG